MFSVSFRGPLQPSEIIGYVFRVAFHASCVAGRATVGTYVFGFLASVCLVIVLEG